MKTRYLIFVFAVFLFLRVTESFAQVSVLTHHNDLPRTGANLQETLLNTTNVNSNTFGKLFAYAVDGDIYAQPLYVPGVSIPGKGVHNVIYVATQNDTVYAFDADSNAGANGAPLWQINFTNPALGITTVPALDVTDPFSGNIRKRSQVGIMGTPVIDATTGTLYVVARTKESGAYFQRLHALDIASGAEKFGGPRTITASVPGFGGGSVNGQVSFNAKVQNQRPGLVLDRGTVYITWSSHDDWDLYHGWVIAYDATTLAQSGVFNVTPNGYSGGIWQSGQPPAVDADGNLYLITGNGDMDLASGGTGASSSYVRLSPRTLQLQDWFEQCDAAHWNDGNEDVNSGGVLLFPSLDPLHPFVLGGGKEGRFFVLNSANLGHTQATPCTLSSRDAQIPETFQATNGGHIHGSPVYYVSPSRGPLTYVWAETDFLKAFSIDPTRAVPINPTPVSQSSFTAPPGMPGGFLSISANGSTPGTGILWANMPYQDDAYNMVVTGILRAFDASDLNVELWNSRMNSVRDDFGNFAKYVPPTIAEGKVYLPTFSGQLVVYGLNPPQAQGIHFVQSSYSAPQQAAASVQTFFSGAQPAGNFIAVAVGWNDATSSVQSVTDTAGNTYTLATGPVRGSNLSQSIYYAKNIVASGAFNTVTVQFSQAASFPDVRVAEYSGVDRNAPFDIATGVSGNSDLSAVGPINTATANELLIAANTVFTETNDPGFPYTARNITYPNGDVIEDNFINNAGANSATALLASSGPWVMQIAAFKAQGAAVSTAPTVTSVAPTSGPAAGGTSVTLTGTNFASGATVSFGGVSATNVVVASATSITVTAPAHASGAVSIVVTNPDGQSGTKTGAYTYTTPAPTVSGVSPVSGSTTGGTAVTVTGTNFVSGATVSFGGTAATNVVIVSATSITATTPARSAGVVNVVVTNPDGQTGARASGFTYIAPAPTITGVTPASGPTAGGTSVTITGTNFVSGATVSFGGTAAINVVVASATSMTATTPARTAGAVNVVVTNPDGQIGTRAGGFTYITPAPTVTGVTPASGPTTGGTRVTITGTNFVSGATVSFGGTAATNVIVASATRITATTPARAAGAVSVAVTNPGGQTGTRASGFTYTTAPIISGVSPNSGSTVGGALVTITGANFTAGASVTFGTTAASGVVVNNASSITVTSPARAAGTVAIRVTNPNGQSGTLSAAFTYRAAPTVTSLAPNTGSTSGGTVVTVSGTNFAAGATVNIGGSAATNVSVTSATSISATTPAHVAGAVPVTVTNSDGQSGTRANAFTYATAPIVSIVSPVSGPTTGGTVVTISGANFAAGSTVNIGGVLATNVSVASSTSITATAPPHAAGLASVSVTNSNGQTGSATNAYTYVAPTTGVSFVQVAAATPQSPVQTVSVGLPTAQVAGDFNVVIVGWNDTSSTIQSVTDSAGNAYSLAIGPTRGTGLSQAIYYAPNVSGVANTVTVGFSNTVNFPDIRVVEYRGLSALDVSQASIGEGLTSTVSITTTATAKLLLASNTVQSFTIQPGTGFTNRLITSPNGGIVEDQSVGGAGTYTPSATLTDPGNWVIQAVTFK